MKKLLVTTTAMLACVAAFAQGKISFAVDSLHLVYYSTTPGELRGADSSMAGQGVSSTAMPAGVVLVADLYGGTSAGTMTLQKSTTFSTVAGKWTTASVITTLPGGASEFFQVQVHDAAFLTESDAFAGGSYGGESIVFNTTTGASLAYNSIVSHVSPAFSTWADGPYNAQSFGGAGALGSISVHVVPEPATFALAGIGAAALLIFRRRK
jgi:hypothetical protein